MKKKVVVAFFVLLLTGQLYSQGLEGIIVEQLPVDTAIASLDSNLQSDAFTYRIFVDMAQGWEFQRVFGSISHQLIFETSAAFYNTSTYGQTFAMNIDTLAIDTIPQLLYDSWLTINAASSSQLGVLFSEDTNGVVEGTAVFIQSSGGNFNTAFGANMFTGKYSTQSGIYFVSPGDTGPTSTNRVLIGQFTTDGEFSFELNVRIRNTATLQEVNYVARNPVGSEVKFEELIYPPIPGCTNATACNYNSLATLNDGSCIFPDLPCTICLNDTVALYDTDSNGVCDVEQPPLENIIVEKYYVADSLDHISDSNLVEGATTYRIFVDMAPGNYLTGVYGAANQELFMATTSEFYNNSQGGTIANFIDTALFGSNPTIAVDSWISIGNATSAFHDGILKTEDTDGSIITGLNNDDPEAGIPLSVADGLVPGIEKTVLVPGIDLSVFDTGGSLFMLNTGGWVNIDSAQGPMPSNEILIAQVTTDGDLSFNLNVVIETPDNDFVYYVSENPGVDEIQADFLIYPAPIYGCTDPLSCNYDSLATEDDGSCIYPVANCTQCFGDTLILIDTDGDGICNADEIPGCTNPLACNYDSLATDDDGSCLLPVLNCTECVGDTLVLIDSDGDGVCDAEEVYGCTDPLSCNYDSLATEEDGSCIYPVANCTQCFGDTLILIDTDGDGICNADEIPGCTNPLACNYDSLATDDNGSCILPIANCTECLNDTLVLIDFDGDGICDAADPNPFELPYSIGNTQNTCLLQDICIPLIAVDSISDVIGFDIVMQFNPDKLVPTGALEINNNFINEEYVDYNLSYNVINGIVNASIYLKSGAPVNTTFNGSGEIFCVGFAQTPGLYIQDTLVFEMPTLIESHSSSASQKPVKQGIYTTVKDSLVNVHLTYWKDKIPIAYDSLNTGSYLITNIYPSLNYCGERLNDSVQPNLYGDAFYDINKSSIIEINRDILPTTDVMRVINAYDAVLTLKVLLDRTDFIPNVYQLIAMDVNADGVVSAGDVSQINMRTVSIVNEFKQQWNFSGASNGKPSKDWLFVSIQDANTLPEFQISSTYPEDDNVGYSKWNVPVLDHCIYLPGFDDNCSIPKQNIVGILLGDVDGSYKYIAPDGLLKSAVIPGNKVLIDCYRDKLNDYLVVDLSINAENSFYSFDFSLKYDSSKLSFDKVLSKNYDFDFFEIKNSSDSLKLTLGSVDYISTNENLLSLGFKAKDENVNCNDLNPDYAMLNGGESLIAFKGDVINEISNNVFEDFIVFVYPNPAGDELTVRVSEPASVQLCDISGKQIIKEIKVLGNEPRTILTHDLQKGIYLLRVYNNRFIKTQKIIIVK